LFWEHAYFGDIEERGNKKGAGCSPGFTRSKHLDYKSAVSSACGASTRRSSRTSETLYTIHGTRNTEHGTGLFQFKFYDVRVEKTFFSPNRGGTAVGIHFLLVGAGSLLGRW